jgi:hypothetical membrane protein
MRENEVDHGVSGHSSSASINRWLAVCGIVAPFLFIFLVLGMGLLEPGYDHRSETMSVLGGVGELRGAVFNVGLVLMGGAAGCLRRRA